METEAMFALAEKAAARWRYLANPHTGLELEDVMGLCLLGILEARATYDPARKVRFPTWAFYGMKNALFHAARDAGLIRIPAPVQDNKEYEKMVFAIPAGLVKTEGRRVGYERTGQ